MFSGASLVCAKPARERLLTRSDAVLAKVKELDQEDQKENKARCARGACDVSPGACTIVASVQGGRSWFGQIKKSVGLVKGSDECSTTAQDAIPGYALRVEDVGEPRVRVSPLAALRASTPRRVCRNRGLCYHLNRDAFGDELRDAQIYPQAFGKAIAVLHLHGQNADQDPSCSNHTPYND